MEPGVRPGVLMDLTDQVPLAREVSAPQPPAAELADLLGAPVEIQVAPDHLARAGRELRTLVIIQHLEEEGAAAITVEAAEEATAGAVQHPSEAVEAGAVQASFRAAWDALLGKQETAPLVSLILPAPLQQQPATSGLIAPAKQYNSTQQVAALTPGAGRQASIQPSRTLRGRQLRPR